MAVTAGSSVLASGVAYYAFVAAWLNVFLTSFRALRLLGPGRSS